MVKVQLNFEFDLHEEQEEFQIQAKAQEMHTMLTYLYASMRQATNRDDLVNPHSRALIHKWRGMIDKVSVL